MVGLTGVQGTRESSFSIIGYLPEYRVETVSPEKLIPITDLIYFGIKPPANGHLPVTPVKNSILRKLHEIKHITKCRLLICVGGWGRSTGFPALAGNKEFRGEFISNISSYCRANGFDGIDYYFIHSYEFNALNPSDVIATVSHGNDIAAIVNRERIYGFQFHPEKSQRAGLGLLESFLLNA